MPKFPPSFPGPNPDVEPWYTQAWPWGLILGPAIVVVACIYTAWFAINSADPMVVDDYYKQGMAVNRSLERDQMAARHGLHAQIKVAAGGVIEISLRSRVDYPWPDALSLILAHPAAAERDHLIALHVTRSSTRAAAYVADAPARLDTVAYQLVLQDGGESWRLTGKANPVRQPSIELAPLPVAHP